MHMGARCWEATRKDISIHLFWDVLPYRHGVQFTYTSFCLWIG